MSKISDIHSREILDSRATPTIETTVVVDSGVSASASVPSGASTGSHEAAELRDGDQNRYHGKGVLRAIEHIHGKIKTAILGKDITRQEEIDHTMIELDGTANKGSLGANAILSVSLACARAAARSLNQNLHTYIQSIFRDSIFHEDVAPMFNVVNGGMHADGNLDIQEFMIIPVSGTKFETSLQMGVEIYHNIKSLLSTNGLSTNVGDEGGFAPSLSSNRKALEVLIEAIGKSPYKIGKDIVLGLDIAALSFYKNGGYVLKDSKTPLTPTQWMDYVVSLKKEFDIFLIEDPLFEDDWDNWTAMTKQIGNTTKIVGDDLLVTNKDRLQKAIDAGACNSILVKVNQIGTLTETLNVIRLAKEAKFTVIISHRSGETTDDFIADLAVGVGADFVKFGAPARGERVAKYNRLLQIYSKMV